jgi:hypothetical protein
MDKMRIRALILTSILILNCAVLEAEEIKVGTTFSRVQCAYLDMDPRKTYLDILDMGFDLIRLGAYWSHIEKQEGVFDFSELDWQIEEAGKKKMPVVVTVGMKAPRWPEYFIPDWVLQKVHIRYGRDVSKNAYLRERTLGFIKAVVTRYKDNPAVKFWQVENEPLMHIGPEKCYIGRAFLEEEVRLVRDIDGGRRPVILTTATYPNRFLRVISNLFTKHDYIRECLAICDIMAINVYSMVGHRSFGLDLYFIVNPGEFDLYFSKLVAMIKESGKIPWVTELQAEPWEPGHLVYTGREEPRTGKRDETVRNFRALKEMGVDTVLLWGSEYWLYRRDRFGDTRWVKTAREILRER